MVASTCGAAAAFSAPALLSGARGRSRARSVSTRARRPRVATAVFLPDGGGGGGVDEERRKQASGGSVDRVLEGTGVEYDTWAGRNARRSLSAVRGWEERSVGADELNAADGERHLQRLRHVLAPDEAFGAIFAWDAVLGNARELELRAWGEVAADEGLAPPDMDDVLRAEAMAPEAAVHRVFCWTREWSEVKRLVFLKGEAFERLQTTWEYAQVPGVEAWLDALHKYGIKSVLCAPRPRACVQRCVAQAGLQRFFATPADMVTVEDEYESMEQMYLMASIKLDRPPAKCVVFTDTPAGITAGREVSARVVALVGAHPAYEVKAADQTVGGFADLVVFHVRSLFAEGGTGLPEPETQLEDMDRG